MLCDVPLKPRLPALFPFNVRVPLLTILPATLMGLLGMVRVLPLPTDIPPPIVHASVKALANGTVTVPAPVAPTEKLPLTVQVVVPVGGVGAQAPLVLS